MWCLINLLWSKWAQFDAMKVLCSSLRNCIRGCHWMLAFVYIDHFSTFWEKLWKKTWTPHHRLSTLYLNIAVGKMQSNCRSDAHVKHCLWTSICFLISQCLDLLPAVCPSHPWTLLMSFFSFVNFIIIAIWPP